MPGARADERMIARFDALFAELSEIGRANGTGLHRLAFGAADAEARAVFAARAGALGLHVHTDEIGNQFALVRPPAPADRTVLLGSHLDSQPDGGRFDGQLGVAAALAVVAELGAGGGTGGGADGCTGGGASSGGAGAANVGAVNWANEEGARFQPSVMGSSVFTGQLALRDALAARDAGGAALGEELAQRGLAGGPTLPGTVVAYAELHVEQGPVLEREGIELGIVDRTWAAYKADVRVHGVQTHTGPTPMAQRVDALAAAGRLIAQLRELGLADPEQALHTAAAWMRITPNSPNATPSLVEFKAELRSPDEARLRAARAALTAAAGELERETGVRCEFGAWSERRAVGFDPAAVALASAAVAAAGIRARRVPTIAGHDAVIMNAASIPTALLFTPSADGITHHAAEYTALADQHRGVRALAAVAAALIARV